MILDEDGNIDATCARDENEQAIYLRELLENLPHRPDPRHDLDMASFGLVKILEGGRGSTYPDMAWEPKKAFHALANTYAGE